MTKTAAKKTATTARKRTTRARSAAPKTVSAKKAAPKASSRTAAQSKTAKTASAKAADLQNATQNLTQLMSSSEMPEMMRSLAENTMSKSRDFYENARDAVGQATEALENTITNTGENMYKVNIKMLDMAQENVTSSFDYAKSLASARDMNEILELQSHYALARMEKIASHTQQLGSMTSEIANSAVEPLKAKFQ